MQGQENRSSTAEQKGLKTGTLNEREDWRSLMV